LAVLQHPAQFGLNPALVFSMFLDFECFKSPHCDDRDDDNMMCDDALWSTYLFIVRGAVPASRLHWQPAQDAFFHSSSL